ncbi:MAG TPA: hypothetical protein PKX27_08235 [Bacteroidales bacterium]|nr:hypothetical protein [Bacteroidales bacterium]HOX75047.1 hypothetical protein [Bacteroidales bacterium]HPM87956.1 hypothetical protein [Bacteroidales bacterium]HQM70018.1 hypothetical protein [Bacteroidales bacterium]
MICSTIFVSGKEKVSLTSNVILLCESYDVYVDGYPSTTTTTHNLCNVSRDQVELFEQTNKGSETSKVDNVTYTSNHFTKCTYK